MGSFVEWKANLVTGNDTVDDQHKKLVDLINALHEAMKTGKTREILGGVLTELAEYTDYHFKAEEKLFSGRGYPKEAEHKTIHKDLMEQVTGIRTQYDAGKAGISVQLLDFLKDWLVTHIKVMDKEAADYMQKTT
jgi:hemerythrin